MPGRWLRTGLVMAAVGALGACASTTVAPPPLATGPSAAPSAALETRGLYRIACEDMPVFAEPSDRAPRLDTLPAGALIGAQDDGSAWAVVRQNGSDGFVDWRCLVPPEDFDPAERVEVAIAEPSIAVADPAPAFAVADAGPSFPAPARSGFVFDAPSGVTGPAFDPETAPFDPSFGYNPLDRQAGGAPAETGFRAPPEPASPRVAPAFRAQPVFEPPPSTTRGPQIAAARAPPVTAAAPRAALTTPEEPGLRPPPPEQQFGAMGTTPPDLRRAARPVNRPSLAALPPAAPGRSAMRPRTQFGPPPRYSAILRDERGPASPLVARAPPARESGRYAVQIGSYRVPENAARAIARAQAMGFAPEIVRAGALRRIRLTGFGDYASAEAERARYLAAGGDDAYVVRM